MGQSTVQDETRRQIAMARRAQIFRVDAKGVILDITDPDVTSDLVDRSVRSEGKRPHAPRYELILVQYDEQKAQGERGRPHTHWIEESDLDLLCQDILFRVRGEKGEKGYAPFYSEYKGGYDRDLDRVVSRQMHVRFNDGLRIGPVYEISFKKVDGEEGDKGQVQPKKDGQVHYEGVIRIRVDDARQLALRIQRYIQAKLTAQLAQDRGARRRTLADLNQSMEALPAAG